MLVSSVGRVCIRQDPSFPGKLPEKKYPDQVIPVFRVETGMACISQRGGYWRAEIRWRGYRLVYRTFDTNTKQRAQKWARCIEGEMGCDSFVDRSEPRWQYWGNTYDQIVHRSSGCPERQKRQRAPKRPRLQERWACNHLVPLCLLQRQSARRLRISFGNATTMTKLLAFC